ncbi:MAG TPA: proton-conducting transporter membrane subunit [Candidatus Baltobacteraceae bacterium]|nr:proton-conducting transporter membrane subunit [Candidatus Baltobacteraceae bacterium]
MVAFPALAMTLSAFLKNRHLRLYARVLFAAAALAGTVVAIPSMNWLSATFATVVSVLCAIVVLFSTGILPKGADNGAEPWSRKPAYFILLGAFWSSMLLAVTSVSFIGLWTGISATTIATTFLVAYTGGKAALEAAWKYLMLCSFGIAIALVGMLFLGRAAMSAGIAPDQALSWSALASHAALMNVPLTRVALTLMLVGFATKAGLVPMHAWLPDAHSKAPAPVSALLSGLLVSCALYAIVRVQSVAAHTASAPMFDGILLYGGTASVLVASLLMLAQRDVKRLLSYSTVEHAGIVALALGLATPLAAFAALYHILAHAFAKALAFLSVGIVQEQRGTTTIGHMHGLWHVRGGREFLAALVALAGIPPFGLFFSELLIVVAAAQSRQWIVLALAIVGLLLAFAALLRLAVTTQSGIATEPILSRPQTSLAAASVAVACVVAVSVAIPLVLFLSWSQSAFALLAAMLARS